MKRFPTHYILLALFLSGTALSYGQDSTQAPVARADWKELKAKHYIIYYPYSWRLQDNSDAGFTLYVPGPKSFGAFEKNISLSVQDLADKNLDLDGYTYLSKRQIHTLVDNSDLLEDERVDSIGVPFHDIIYTGDYYEQQLKWRMRFWVVKDQVFILTYTASIDTYGLNSKLAVEIMDTFRVIQMGGEVKKKKKGKGKEKKKKKGKMPTTDVKKN